MCKTLGHPEAYRQPPTGLTAELSGTCGDLRFLLGRARLALWNHASHLVCVDEMMLLQGSNGGADSSRSWERRGTNGMLASSSKEATLRKALPRHYVGSLQP